MDRMIISLSHHKTISFQMFRVEHLMPYIEFSMAMGLVDVEYTCTKLYSQLHVDLLVHRSTNQVWTQTLRGLKT